MDDEVRSVGRARPRERNGGVGLVELCDATRVEAVRIGAVGIDVDSEGPVSGSVCGSAPVTEVISSPRKPTMLGTALQSSSPLMKRSIAPALGEIAAGKAVWNRRHRKLRNRRLAANRKRSAHGVQNDVMAPRGTTQ